MASRRRPARPRSKLDEKRHALLHSLAKDRTNSPAVIAATPGISRSSFNCYLAEEAEAVDQLRRGRSATSAIATPAMLASRGTRRAARARPDAARPSSRTRSARPSQSLPRPARGRHLPDQTGGHGSSSRFPSLSRPRSSLLQLGVPAPRRAWIYSKGCRPEVRGKR